MIQPVLLLGVLGHARGHSNGIDAVLLDYLPDIIAALYEAKVYAAVVYRRIFFVVYAYFQLGKVFLIRAFFRREEGYTI